MRSKAFQKPKEHFTNPRKWIYQTVEKGVRPFSADLGKEYLQEEKTEKPSFL